MINFYNINDRFGGLVWCGTARFEQAIKKFRKPTLVNGTVTISDFHCKSTQIFNRNVSLQFAIESNMYVNISFIHMC